MNNNKQLIVWHKQAMNKPNIPLNNNWERMFNK